MTQTRVSSPSATGVDHSVVTVHSVDELEALRRWRPMPGRSSLALDIPGLSQAGTQATSDRIVRFAEDCGCSLGAKCMTAGFVAMFAYLIWNHDVFSAGFLWRLPLTLAAALIGAVVGKLTGLARAHRRLNREIDRLLAARASLHATDS